MVVSGMLNKQIADDLGTAENTVKVHLSRAMEKMHAQSLADPGTNDRKAQVFCSAEFGSGIEDQWSLAKPESTKALPAFSPSAMRSPPFAQ
jgi:Bacterial regulatory proteins, luxR family